MLLTVFLYSGHLSIIRMFYWSKSGRYIQVQLYINLTLREKNYLTFPDFLAFFDVCLIFPDFFQNSNSRISRFRSGYPLPLLHCDSWMSSEREIHIEKEHWSISAFRFHFRKICWAYLEKSSHFGRPFPHFLDNKFP